MQGFFNVALLTGCNALAFSVIPIMMFSGALIGADLSGGTSLATLPIAAMVVGTAVCTVPVALLMKRLGRKTTFFLSFLGGGCACILASIAIDLRSFALFCLSATGIGLCAAATQQLRFAAMESVPVEKSPTVASQVLGGGIVAAFLGPELAFRGQHLTSVDYQGSFWLGSLCLLSAALLVLLLKPIRRQEITAETPVRPLAGILSNPALCLAIVSGCVGFAVMTFIMTATPISMHHYFHHSLADTKWVIQSHIAAMFLPSFISPVMFRWLGIQGMIKAGLVAYGLTLAIGLSDTSVLGFWCQLVFLGIGWNFLFLAGTVLLPQTYRKGEQFKAQAVNDATIFSTQAVAALTSGWVFSYVNWQFMLLICLAPMLFLLLTLAWHRRSSQGHPLSASL